MELTALLTAFQQQFGTAPLKVDSEGCCDIAFDDVSITLFPLLDKHRIALLSTVAQAPSGDWNSLAEQLLSDVRARGNASVSFAFDPESQTICLQSLLNSATLDLDDFVQGLLEQITQTRKWRTAIEQSMSADPDAFKATESVTVSDTSSQNENSGDLQTAMMNNWLPI